MSWHPVDGEPPGRKGRPVESAAVAFGTIVMAIVGTALAAAPIALIVLLFS